MRSVRPYSLAVGALVLLAVAIPGISPAGPPAPIVVNTVADENGTGDDISLREAIAAAAAGGTIYFAASLDQQSITLTNGELLIDKPLEIVANGTVVNGNDASRVFHTSHTSGVVKISGMTITGGRAGAGDGGGVLNDGGAGLWLVDCALVSNDATNGGGISNQLQHSTLTVERCLIWGNSATTGGFGGGIDNYTLSTVLVSNSTITGNTTGGQGGGISNTRFSVIKVVNCTIVNNAGVGAGTGGGLYNTEADSFSVGNTILGSNTSSDSSASDVSGSQSFTSLGGNYIGTAPGGMGFTNGSNGDQVGTVASPLPNVVGVLADNGGKTATHNLFFPSTAVDAGRQDLLTAENFPSGFNVDQRGALYPRHGVVDIGALEADPRVLLVDTLADEDDGTLVGGVSLRDALTEAPAASTINFSHDLLPGGGAPSVIQLVDDSGITISRPVTINGLGARELVVRGGLHDRIFSLTHAAGTVKISGLTITNGDAGSGGGAVSHTGGGNLHLLDCTISDSYCHSGNGGGIAIAQSSATIERCTISGNGFGRPSQTGGGIHFFASTGLISNCTISGNQATAAGGGVFASDSDVKMVNCTVRGNSIGSGTDGAGIASSPSGTFSLGNTLIEGNLGGAFFSEIHLPSTLITLGGNYLSRYAGVDIVDGVNGDQVGTYASPLPAITGALANNGGPTDTHALQFPSRGVGRGNQFLRTEEYFPGGDLDQTNRIRLGLPDVGAVEARPNRITVTTTNDELDGVSFGEGISFREALDCIDEDGTVVFPAGSALLVVPITLGELLIDRNVYIARDDGGPVSIEGNRSTRMFRIATNPLLANLAQVSMSNLTIRGGISAGSGGGILVMSGNLSLIQCTITDNEAQYGGGLSLTRSASSASVSYSTISGNSGNQGSKMWSGGIDVFNGATLEINNSTISGNSGSFAGGIAVEDSTASITSCTIAKNQATGPNGAGGVAVIKSSALTIADSIVQMNTASDDPMFSDIALQGTVSLTNEGGNYMGIVAPGYPFGNEADDDYAGIVASPLPPAVEEDLTYRGGTTRVHFPLNPGPVINKGKDTLTEPSPIDQRGSMRKFEFRHDIGAVEWSPFCMDGIPEELGCPPTNGFQVSENDGWVYASVDRAAEHTYYVLFSERPHDSRVVDNSALTAAQWDVYMKFASSNSAGFFDEVNDAISPDPDRHAVANSSYPGGDRFEVAVLKQFVGGHRSFVSIVEMDGDTIVAQYPAGNGSPLTRDEFLPVITGISTCTDLSALRELIVDQLLGIPFAPRHQRANFPLEYLDTNDDLLLDATDASYLER